MQQSDRREMSDDWTYLELQARASASGSGELREHPRLKALIEPVLEMVWARRPPGQIGSVLAHISKSNQLDQYNAGIAIARVLQELNLQRNSARNRESPPLWPQATSRAPGSPAWSDGHFQPEGCRWVPMPGSMTLACHAQLHPLGCWAAKDADGALCLGRFIVIDGACWFAWQAASGREGRAQCLDLAKWTFCPMDSRGTLLDVDQFSDVVNGD